MADLEYSASLNDDEVIRALRNIDRNIDKMANDGQQAFENVAKSSSSSGAKIGVMAGVVSSLTTEFINLGKQAVQTLVSIGQQSIDTAVEFDTLKSRLFGIFDGSQAEADEAFNFIQDRSRKLGIDLGELAGAFLPKTESLDQFERVAKVATALARSDPEQGAIGARIALIEALSGTFTSLQRRFEIPKSDIDRIKAAFDEKGIEGFLSTLEDVLAKSGKGFDDLSDTAQASFDRIEVKAKQGLGEIGATALPEIQRQLDNLGSILDERGDDFQLIANAVGDVIANIVEFVGTIGSDFLANLDEEQVIAIVNDFNALVDSAQDFVEIISGAELPQALLDQTQQLVSDLRTAFDTINSLTAQARAENARNEAERKVILEAAQQDIKGAGFSEDSTAFKALSKLSEEALGIPGFTELEQKLAGIVGNEEAGSAAVRAKAEGEKAYQAELNRTNQILENTRKEQEERRKEQQQRAADQKKPGATGAADPLLAARQEEAAQEARIAEAEAAAEKIAEIEGELQEEISKILIDSSRDRLKIIRDDSFKRVDLERKNKEKIEDILRDFNRDAGKQDRARAKKLADIDLELADKRIDAEKDFQDEIDSIRNRFAIDQEEAARKRDAIGFLRLQRQQQEAVQEAEKGRRDDVEKAVSDAKRKREELKTQQQFENEEARIGLEEKLEDQRIAFQRELDEQEIAKNRKLTVQNLEEQQRLQDARDANAKKLEEFKASLDAEVAALLEAEKTKTAILEEETEKRKEILRGGTVDPRRQQSSRARNRQLAATGPQASFQSGGFAGAGQAVTVHPPETFIPSRSGTIVPMARNFVPQQAVASVDNSRNLNQQLGILDPSSITPTMIAIARQVVLQVQSEIE